MGDQAINLIVNGQQRTVTTDPLRPLLEVLREDLGLTGTKYGCGAGQCAACTVLVDDKPRFSCMTPIRDVAEKSILTIEGLSTPGATPGAKGKVLHPVQEAYLAEGAFQCGYCTPGMIMATVALLAETPQPTDSQIIARLNRHLCRCGGYARVIKAVHRAAGMGK
jgi:aerobic-type carbon monoxide dehydrogenase small subunit (CoxS/CutS family)